jgi:predicted phage terminase large subunit-like protein
LFRVDKIKRLDTAPDNINRVVRGWDLAATRAIGSRNADWTCGTKLARTNTGSYVVLDVYRLRGDPSEIEAAILRTAQADGKGVEISLPQDPGQAGLAQAQNLVKMLAGFNVQVTRESGDKATRAAPVAAQVNIGNVSVVTGPWTASFVDELAGFPSSKWDDQVDSLSRAFNVMTPAAKGQAMLELAKREMAKWDAERGGKAEPIARTYQPGSIEYAREQARIAAEKAKNAEGCRIMTDKIRL